MERGVTGPNIRKTNQELGSIKSSPSDKTADGFNTKVDLFTTQQIG